MAAYVQLEQYPDEDSRYYKGILDGLISVRDDIKNTMRFEAEIKSMRRTTNQPTTTL